MVDPFSKYISGFLNGNYHYYKLPQFPGHRFYWMLYPRTDSIMLYDSYRNIMVQQFSADLARLNSTHFVHKHVLAQLEEYKRLQRYWPHESFFV